MAPSLPRRAPAKAAAPAKTSYTPSTVLASLTQFASLLPPTAAVGTSNLNPLADLVALFGSIPVDYDLIVAAGPSSRKEERLEENRQALHSGFYLLKNIFESLIGSGRLFGTLKPKAKKARSNDGAVKKVLEMEEGDVEAVKNWLRGLWEQYLNKGREIVGLHWDLGVRSSTLTALMAILRTESLFLTSLHPTRAAQFGSKTFAIIVKAILLPGLDGEEVTLANGSNVSLLRDDTKEEWNKWWNKNDDIRYHFLKEASALVKSLPSKKKAPANLARNLLSVLEGLVTNPTASAEINDWWCAKPTPSTSRLSKGKGQGTGPPSKKRKEIEVVDTSTGVFDSSSESESDSATVSKTAAAKLAAKSLPSLLQLGSHKKAFQQCWLDLLSLPLEEGEVKRILVVLHRQVLPGMGDPRRVMDWLVDCVSSGGTIGILALNGLFTLMVKHNLEYPNFFQQLYSLMDKDILHVKYRPRFFRLLEIFMSSSHLPSNLVASIIKRLARLSLSAPPAGIITILPFIYNLLKLHAGCMPLIHRPDGNTNDDDDDTIDSIVNDPFDPLEQDPLKTNALSSSLWEIATLRNHYNGSVSGLAKVFEEVMSKQAYAMEDFLDHSYGTMFETEVTRTIRNAPALAPVPKRQPIGDDFFPITAKSEAMETGEERDPVDFVSQLFSF